jgi:putative nucleotidyltransferase with HDIG domain
MVTVSQADVNSFINKTLPPLPGSAMHVVSLLQDINTSTRAIADAVGRDPMLTAKILRAANSPLYVSQRNVISLPKAVLTLGNQAIYLLVISFTAFDAFAQEIRTSIIGCSIWEHSLAVALTAREIGLTLKLRNSEELFTCGLLHDIGRLLFLRHDPQFYTQIDNKLSETAILEVEQNFYGFTHAQVGALAMNRWGLPVEVAQIVANHHAAGDQNNEFATETMIINAADELINARSYDTSAAEIANQLVMNESVAALKLSVEQIEDILEKTESGLRELIQILS